MKIAMWVAGVVGLLSVGLRGEEKVVKETFSGRSPGKDWLVSSRSWRPTKGELVGVGSGHIEYQSAVAGDFVLSFEAETEEKANIEVHLVDAKGKAVFAFAFLGQYHSALDGVKCCILKDNRFVNVNARMWIYPGRRFKFEVRRAKNQYQMFLNRELGPFFVDREPPKNVDGLRVRITYAPESKRDKVRFDNLQLVLKK